MHFAHVAFRSLTLTLFCFFSALTVHAQSGRCWAMALDGNDPSWPGFDNLYIQDAARMSDGFVVCGTTYQHIFPSKNGMTFGRTNFGGLYVAKYDLSGNLVWIDYAIDSTYLSPSEKSTINSIAVDNNDNVYICGMLNPASRFYYNGGTASTRIVLKDTGRTNTFGATPFFVAKLNKDGAHLWHAQYNFNRPLKLSYSPTGRLIIAGTLEPYFNNSVITANDSTRTYYYPHTSGENRYFVYWADTLDGRLRNYTHIKSRHNNQQYLCGLANDGAGNTILSGTWEHGITYYSAGNTDSFSNVPPNINYGQKMFVVKFDTAGKLQWRVFDHMGIGTWSNGNGATSLSVAKDGTVYLSGTPSFYNPADTIYFVNADSSRVPVVKRPRLIYSISKNGHLKWASRNFSQANAGIYANDTAVYFSGTAYFNQDLPLRYTDTIYAPNSGAFLIQSSHNPAISFVRLDTAGNPLWAGKTGISNGPNYYNTAGLLPSDSGGLILYAHYNRYNGTDSTLFYNDTVKVNGRDGMMLSYRPGLCDGINTPGTMPRIFETAPFIDSLLCLGSTVTIYDSLPGAYYANNWLYMQLSASNGSFGAVTIIGNAAGGSKLIQGTIPTVAPGNSYKIRLATTSPQRFGPEHKVSISAVTLFTASISSDQGNTINGGQSATFRTTLSNGGANPQYQWKINGLPVPGANSDSFATSSLMDQDLVSVTTRSSLHCAKPDSVTSSLRMTVVQEVGVNTPQAIPGICVFPNPSVGTIRVYTQSPVKGACQLQLISSAGNTVYRQALPAGSKYLDTTINFPEHLPAGSYILVVKFEEGCAYRHVSLIR